MKTYLNWTWSSNLIYYIASFFGLAPFIVRNNSLHPVNFARKIYSLFLATVNVSWLFFMIIQHGLKEANVLRRFVEGIYWMVIAVSVLCALFNFAFKSREMIDIMHRIIAIKEELVNLGSEDLHDKNRNKFYAKIISTNCVVFVIRFYLAYITDDRSQSTRLRAIGWIGNFLVFMLCHNVVLIFVETMICIKHSFKSLNNRLQGTTQPDDDFISSCIQQTYSLSANEGSEAQVQIITDSKNIHLAVGDVEKIGKIHRELCYLAQSTTDFFTVPIVLIILQHFTRMLSSCYFVYEYTFTLTDAYELTEFTITVLLRFGARTTITVIECFLIADACHSVCRVGNSTKMILLTVWNKFNDEKLQNEFFIVSLQLMQKPITVTAFGFFNLGYSYVFKIFYAVLAYFIIMVQLDASRRNPGG